MNTDAHGHQLGRERGHARRIHKLGPSQPRNRGHKHVGRHLERLGAELSPRCRSRLGLAGGPTWLRPKSGRVFDARWSAAWGANDWPLRKRSCGTQQSAELCRAPAGRAAHLHPLPAQRAASTPEQPKACRRTRAGRLSALTAIKRRHACVHDDKWNPGTTQSAVSLAGCNTHCCIPTPVYAGMQHCIPGSCMGLVPAWRSTKAMQCLL